MRGRACRVGFQRHGQLRQQHHNERLHNRGFGKPVGGHERSRGQTHDRSCGVGRTTRPANSTSEPAVRLLRPQSSAPGWPTARCGWPMRARMKLAKRAWNLNCRTISPPGSCAPGCSARRPGGRGRVEVITRKDVMVRLQAPRFFVEKDEAVLSANVHNELDKAQGVRGVIELEGGVTRLSRAGPGAAGPKSPPMVRSASTGGCTPSRKARPKCA